VRTANRSIGAAASGKSRAVVFRGHWFLLMALVRRDVKKRYATSMLGSAWTVLQPVILVAVYVTAFGFILRPGRTEDDAATFAIFLLSGLLPYLAINEGLQRATSSLREDAALLEHRGFPAEILPVSRVVTASVTEGVGLVLLIVLAALNGNPPGFWIVVLPILVLLRLLMTCGFALVISMLAVFVTDLKEVLSLMLTAWLFLTPIFYTVDSIPGSLGWLTALNPLYHLVGAYRNVLIDDLSPFPFVLPLAAWAIVLAASGLWFFRKAMDRGKDFL
jgi:ABC-type polysaccharide/polyol phosphate export permease